MVNDLKSVFAEKNLALAWQRIKRNTDRVYKGYFRPLYTAYAAAEFEYLKSLAKRIQQNNFTPTLPTKIYIPKPSGILRPITLLSIEDQIVYQAFGNRIAMRLNKRIKRLHYSKVFGNIFAGANSKWFYENWAIAYNRYNFSLRESFQDGFNYAADFDLTACYDSIDHSVLKHFLISLGFSEEFCRYFLECLCYWTCVDSDKGTERIFHGHGIPQGPLTSGLISDIVLHVFDINKRIPREVKYFRYVDDIKLLSRNELSLRKALIVLDYTSKMVGLFPQTSKIGIHKIDNIEDEIKTISNPPEPSFAEPDPVQNTIHSRINELSPNYSVIDETRFKYTLAAAMPRYKQNKRLFKILKKQPHLYSSIMSYFGRYYKMPKTLSKDIYELLVQEDPPYFSFNATILKESYGKVGYGYEAEIIKFCKRKWTELANYKVADDYRDALLLWIITQGSLSYPELLDLLEKQSKGWLHSKLLFYINEKQYGIPSYETLLNRMIRLPDKDDVAIAAAYLLMTKKAKILPRKKEINHIATIGLNEFGLIKSINAPESLIPKCINEIIGSNVVQFDWKKALKRDHKDIERQFLTIRAYSKTDPTAFFMSMAVVLDYQIFCLVKHDNTIGHYNLGCFGSFINSSTSRFANKYPKFHALCQFVNSKRQEADLAHPISRSTGKKTKRLKHNDINIAKSFIKNGFKEYTNKW